MARSRTVSPGTSLLCKCAFLMYSASTPFRALLPVMPLALIFARVWFCASDLSSDPRRDSAASRPDPETCSKTTADPSWSTVFPSVAHNLWRYYNAVNSIAAHYDKLALYISTVEADVNASGLAAILCKWGDWNPVKKTPCQITAATSFIHDLRRMADLATALGRTVGLEAQLLALDLYGVVGATLLLARSCRTGKRHILHNPGRSFHGCLRCCILGPKGRGLFHRHADGPSSGSVVGSSATG